ncbi:ATP-binding cassette domain-containing protein [Lacticaseibacillus yichunensis]|uniref:ATP-binding cassette domain-containing protein n=1 Tax=Lacticaseibacillus yichunensis TaxID=2486015 RepID=A0ABW4CS30_9LACO|nr:ABC transporter ATP-binding protein [Lacticaseibacillus yichunensis]
MLTLNDISLDFPTKKQVIDHLSLALDGGQIVGLVAPNGTGKTTLLRVILNELQPKEGSVTIDGLQYTSQANARRIHRKLCSFPVQDDLFNDLSGLAHLRYYCDSWGADRAKLPALIEELQMINYVKNPVHTYSLGMRQRLCFAMVVASDAPIMLLDELMNGLDPVNVELVSKVLLRLKGQGKLLLMVSHLLPNLEAYADQVLFMQDGRFALTVLPKDARPQFLRVATGVLDGANEAKLRMLGATEIGGALFIDSARVAEVAPLLKKADGSLLPFAIGPQSLVDHYHVVYGEA